jgi:hypothetical protein
MGPAGGLPDAASVVEVMEACVAIGLQGPAEVGQMATRMLALAIRSVSEPDTWGSCLPQGGRRGHRSKALVGLP